MPSRASVFEKPRIGLEVTPGTAVAAAYVLQSMTLVPTPVLPRAEVSASGTKVPVGVVGQKEHTDFSFEGALAYNDAAFILDNYLCNPTGAVAAGVGTLTYKPSATDPDAKRFWSVESGSAAGACKFPGAFLNSLNLSINRTEVNYSGDGMGRAYAEGIVLTANPADVPLLPVSVDTVDVFVADTVAGLANAGARLKRCVSASLSLPERMNGVFTIDSTEASMSDTVEKRMSPTAQIVVEQDSQGNAMMQRMRDRKVFFLRLYMKSNVVVSGATNYDLQITCPCFVNATQRGDQDDLYAGTYDLTLCYESGFAGWIEAVMKTSPAVAAYFGIVP